LAELDDATISGEHCNRYDAQIAWVCVSCVPSFDVLYVLGALGVA
jgi:hypothetical protein